MKTTADMVQWPFTEACSDAPPAVYSRGMTTQSRVVMAFSHLSFSFFLPSIFFFFFFFAGNGIQALAYDK